MQVNPALLDSTTLAFLENKVLRWFGVSLPILNGEYNDEQYQAFYNKTIEPIVIGMGQAFLNAIFSQREQDVGHEIKFYQMNLELMDTKNKMAFVQAMGDRGILTDNQILALFGMAPYEGGNVRHMSLNYIDASLANTYQMLILILMVEECGWKFILGRCCKMAAEIELQGLDELLSQLQQMSDKAGRVENKALKAGAQPIADEMKTLVNVSNIDHLHIRDDIQISGVKSKDGIKYIKIGPGKETNWRAKFLEWGTSKMPAKPFVRISYEHKKNDVLEIMKQTIAEALEL